MNTRNIPFAVWPFLILLLIAVGEAAAKYDVASIPAPLRENAVAVVRENHSRFEVSNESRAKLTERKVITILERKAEGMADLIVPYDSYKRVRSYKVTLYDAQGKKIRDLKKDEFTDRSNSGSSHYDDARILFTDIYVSQLPFTVEMEYELEFRNGFFFFSWYPQDKLELSVEKASHTVVVPRGMEFRHRARNREDLQPTVSADNTTWVWQLESLPAIKNEAYMPPLEQLVPHVLLGSSRFHYGGTNGNMSTWQDYGKWAYELTEGRQTLPAPTRARVQELVAGVEDTTEKVRILYEFMQSRTRYVSIQLGIGGFQPFDAAMVDRTGYGDCKALVNYTMALLKEAGINSIYTLVFSGPFRGDVFPDFPTKAFNHVILAVPLQQDTLWLECTSNHHPTAYLGSSNSGRLVLMITAEGGKLVPTPAYNHAQNQISRHLQARILSTGALEFTSSSRHTGARYEDLLGLFLQGAGQQKRYLQQNLGINNPEISDFSYNLQKTRVPVLEEVLNVSSSQYVSRAGNRILFQPNILSRRNSVPPVMANRTHAVHISESALYSDTVHWELPAGYTIAHLPEGLLLDNEFGFFQANYHQEGNQLTYQRTYFSRKGTHPAEKYADFVDFLNAILNADRAQVVLAR